jgi:hypothetical protein
MTRGLALATPLLSLDVMPFRYWPAASFSMSQPEALPGLSPFAIFDLFCSLLSINTAADSAAAVF